MSMELQLVFKSKLGNKLIDFLSAKSTNMRLQLITR